MFEKPTRIENLAQQIDDLNAKLAALEDKDGNEAAQIELKIFALKMSGSNSIRACGGNPRRLSLRKLFGCNSQPQTLRS
jgi:septal ring factor EnvC (AmiA/AmiB activator)